MEDKILSIIKYYGINHQQRKFAEETFEVEEAIIRAENRFEPIQDIDHIAEEIADCMVLLKQFQRYYGIPDEEIKRIMNYKINRQIERIKKEGK